MRSLSLSSGIRYNPFGVPTVRREAVTGSSISVTAMRRFRFAGNEVELIQIMDEVFRRFGIRVCIKMNNRKILSGIAEISGKRIRLSILRCHR